ncbi:hypothetical protein TNCT_273761 [Trichonephila clavata]|uniref:Uncharacterized protein n=1 Tax=Trichonephila clavata TaxID=2740835 RepID=A0A8X6GMP6_TRICU|nr:hypothetical protein TNCT_273761 [Trichonephila clavata]
MKFESQGKNSQPQHRGLYQSNLDFEALDGAGRRQPFTSTSPDHPNEASITTHSNPLRNHFKVPWNTGTKLTRQQTTRLSDAIFPRRQGFRAPRPHATAPSSGAARKISKSKTSRPRHHSPSSSPLALPFDCDSIVLRLSYQPHANSAPTSPGGRAPVTRPRMRRRPLPVDLEKFRSPKPLHFLFSSSSLATSLHPSTATRSSSLRDSHELCTNSPRRLGFRTPRPHATAPSSGGPRKISKSKNTPLPVLVFISLALPFDCNSIVLRLSYEPHTKSAQTSPDGRAPVPLGRMRQRPLPVLLEKFRSPKTLLLATTRCRRHHLICPSTATRSSRNLHTSLAPTSPDGRAPVTGARIPQRPLPVDLEKFRSPKPLHFLFSSSSLATSLHPSTATRSSSLRDSHELCTNSPRRLGFRTPRPHATAPSSGGPRKISKSKTTRSHHFLLCSSQVSPQRPIHSEPLTTSLHPLGSTSPDGRAPVTRARIPQRPLPVLLEKFQSPKPLVLASSCSSLALPTPTRLAHEPRTHFSRRQGSRHRGPHPTTPSSGGPSPGPLHFTLASNSIFFFLFSKQLSSFRGPL